MTMPELNKILISLGAEDVRLKNLADDKEITAAQLKDILESLEKLAKLSEAVRRHGGDFETYLAQRNSKSGKLPTYLVKVREGNEETVHYFHDEKAVRKFHQENLDLNLFDTELGQELLPLSEAPARTNGSRRRGKLVELHESAAIQKIIAELARKGLKVAHYAASDQPIFELIEGEGEKAVSHPLFSIPEILREDFRDWPPRSADQAFQRSRRNERQGVVRDHDESGETQTPEGRSKRR